MNKAWLERVAKGQKTCPECGTLNNTFVNDLRCFRCGHEWKN